METGPATRIRLDWRLYKRQLRRPLTNARGRIEERSGVIVRLQLEDGRCGYGEAAPLTGFGTESLEEVIARLELLGRDTDLDAIQGVEAHLPCTRFAVECAMVELRGLRLLPPVRLESLPVVALVDLWEPVSERILPALARGHRTLKAKIGLQDPGRELARIEAVARELPSDVRLRLDANGCLSRKTASILLDEFDRLPVEFVEQPLAAEDHEGLVTLARRHPGRVAVEESVVRPRDLARLARAGWDGPVVVKPSLLGTVVLWADAWARFSWPWVFSSAFETRVGAAHALGIAFALSREPRAVGFGISDWLPEDGLGGGCPDPVLNWEDLISWDSSEVWDELAP